MKVYEEYSNEDNIWISKIPKHWKLKKLSQIADERCVKNADNNESHILSLSYGNIVDKKNPNFGLSPKDYSTYQVVGPDDIILRLTDLQNDKNSLRTGIVKRKGIITSAYTCITPKENPSYIHFLLHHYDIIKVFYGLGSGVRQSIGFKEIRELPIPIPPRAEQDKIVCFLDYKLKKINRLIAIKQKQIELLKEKRQAIINKAVTKGIDPDAKMKDSGIEWIGEIPERWEVTTLGSLYDVILGKMLQPKPKLEDDVLKEYITARDIISDQIINTNNLSKMYFSKGELSKYNLNKGDLLVVEGGWTVGKCAIYTGDKDIAFQNHLFKIITNNMDDSLFLNLYFAFLKSSGFIDSIISGATFKGITLSKIKNMPLLIPSDKKVINDYLSKSNIKIEKSIWILQNTIDLLQEYRSRLISDAVTGAIDVSDYKIPEEAIGKAVEA